MWQDEFFTWSCPVQMLKMSMFIWMIPNLVLNIVNDFDVEKMLVDVLHVDVIQHVEDEVEPVQDDVDDIFVVEFFEDDVDDLR